MALCVLRVVDAAGIARTRAIRAEVFVAEQAITVEEELDELDLLPSTAHVLALDDGCDVGTARLIFDPHQPGVVHLTRVAVRREARRTGAGRAVMRALEAVAWHEHATGDPPSVRLELSVMETAVPFYLALGYEVAEERYLEVRIWHHAASKVLRAPPPTPLPPATPLLPGTCCS